MDPIEIEKIEAMNNYNNKKKMHHSSLKNTNSNNNNALFVYILTALTCSIVFFSPFWYPSFESLVVSFPNIISTFLSPKCLFLLGNLIVLVLVGESKLLTSKPSQQATSEVYYNEYVNRSQSLQSTRLVKVSTDYNHKAMVQNECKKVHDVTRSVGRSRSIRRDEGTVVRSLSAEELSRRADDFIARVNRQRRLEATDQLVKWGL